MLDINIEFTKGVLFVRLSGVLTKENEINIEENVVNILIKSGIKKLVFNIKELTIKDNVKLFDNCEKIIKKNNGKMLICSNSNLKYKTVNNELTALKELYSC